MQTKYTLLSSFKILQVERSASEQVIELLDENVIGTPGKSMLYRHAEVRQKISKTPEPFFVNLAIRNRLYGTICLSKRSVRIQGVSRDVFYLRYFTFRQQWRSLPESESKISEKSSDVRDEVSRLMDGEGLEHDGDLVLFAYVDKDNIRSKRLIDEFAFKSFGNFHVLTFSRLFPERDERVKKLDVADVGHINHLLADYYDKEQLVPAVMVDKEDDYYVLSIRHEIVCGVKATRDSWIIKHIPGFMGKLMMKVVPYLPIVGRLFNPHYKFLFMDSIFCKEGYEKDLEILLESVLALHKLYTSIICIDPRSACYHLFDDISLGLTHALMGVKKIDIVAKSIPDNILNPNKPCYVAGEDVL